MLLLGAATRISGPVEKPLRVVARKILRYLGLPDEAPKSTPPSAPPLFVFGAHKIG